MGLLRLFCLSLFRRSSVTGWLLQRVRKGSLVFSAVKLNTLYRTVVSRLTARRMAKVCMAVDSRAKHCGHCSDPHDFPCLLSYETCCSSTRDRGFMNKLEDMGTILRSAVLVNHRSRPL